MARRFKFPRTPLHLALLAGAMLLPLRSGAQELAHVQAFASDVVRAGDAGGRVFAVIDKQAASLSIFSGQGKLLAQAPVLVGQAVGDVAPPDIGTRPLARVKPHEKVTAAGRYVSEGGRNTNGEDIVWLDYDSALSMHRVRNVPRENRLQRLLSPDPTQHRISYGCVNVPVAFYDRYVDPLFSRSAAVVYVLPETRPLASVFPFVRSAQP